MNFPDLIFHGMFLYLIFYFSTILFSYFSIIFAFYRTTHLHIYKALLLSPTPHHRKLLVCELAGFCKL
jgi:hypothetical protein